MGAPPLRRLDAPPLYYPRTIATSPLAPPPLRADELAQASALAGALVDACARAVRAPRTSLQACVIALLSGGHVMIEDVPGVGKTVLAKSLARAAGCDYSRVQCTADLLPADVTGVTVWDQNAGTFLFRAGPVFANLVLVDEINRASPKTQSALLECMEEGQVTVDGETRTLPRPFMIIATQNPVEYEGTFPLPEAQLDRFAVRVRIGYPPPREEAAMILDLAAQDPVDLVRAGRRRAARSSRRAPRPSASTPTRRSPTTSSPCRPPPAATRAPSSGRALAPASRCCGPPRPSPCSRGAASRCPRT